MMRFRAKDLDWQSHPRRSTADHTRRIVEQALEKWKWIAAGAAGLLVLSVIYVAYSGWSSKKEADASALLRKAVSQFEAATPSDQGSTKQEEGVRLLRDVITRYPQSAAAMEATLRLGTLFYVTGQYDEARAVYTAHLEKNPRGPMAFSAGLGIGDTFLAQRNYEKAVETYSRLIEQFPQEPLLPQAHLHLAKAFLGLNRAKDAATTYEKIISTYPNTGWAHNAQAEKIRLSLTPR